MRRILLGCEDEGCTRRRNPEVRTVVSQLGRPDDGTDPSGFYNIEMFAPLIPQGEWRRGITKEKLTQQLSRDLHDAFPGVDFNFSQAIADNVEEAMSGVKGENTVKVVGPDLKLNEAKPRRSSRPSSKSAASRTWACSARSGNPTSRSCRTGSAVADTGSTWATWAR